LAASGNGHVTVDSFRSVMVFLDWMKNKMYGAADITVCSCTNFRDTKRILINPVVFTAGPRSLPPRNATQRSQEIAWRLRESGTSSADRYDVARPHTGRSALSNLNPLTCAWGARLHGYPIPSHRTRLAKAAR
jgi:hypothetical protein